MEGAEKNKKKKITLLTLCAVLFALKGVAEAQQPPTKVSRIGFLTGSSLSSQLARNEAFRQGLRDLGYVEGKNIVIEWRSWEGKLDRQRAFAAELVHLKVDVIVAVGSGDIGAAKEATATIPIVMMVGGDPVASGFITSLARPGGNITGLATLRPELSGKRLELLKEVVPRLSRVAVLVNSSTQDYAQEKKELERAAAAFGLKLQVLDVQSPKDLETAFPVASKEQADAVLFRVAGPVASSQRPQIAVLAIKNRLPAIYELAEYVIINLKAAKQIGLTIPPSVLARADKVIR